MIIAVSEDRKYKLVAVGQEGWYFYSPPIENPEVEMFISVDDPLAVQVAEMLGADPKMLTGSYEAATLMLKKAISQIKRQTKLNKDNPVLAAV